MAGVLAYRPDRSRSAFVFSMTDGSYHADKLIEFLAELRAYFAGEQVIVIWDGLMAHRSKAMTAWLATQRDWLHVERLPAYAPELNPIEQVWGNMKSTELANLCPDILDEVRIATETGLTRIGSNYDLCHSFLDHTGLSFNSATSYNPYDELTDGAAVTGRARDGPRAPCAHPETNLPTDQPIDSQAP
ncbi:transposase [Rhodococcus koreensis]